MKILCPIFFALSNILEATVHINYTMWYDRMATVGEVNVGRHWQCGWHRLLAQFSYVYALHHVYLNTLLHTVSSG